ncbi:hypothetical protein [Streptomyces sp. NPDC051684]|uniref:hypothetical protein n=1 Tax=Streptomyces sp. NPDC051684 TaxID=3365670 RepID=UPI0037892D50
MRRWVPRSATTSVVLRGTLALLVAFVGVLCVFSRAMEQRPVTAERPAVAQVDTHVTTHVSAQVGSPTSAQAGARPQASAASTTPCGKVKAVAESGTSRAAQSEAHAPALAGAALAPDVTPRFAPDAVHARACGPEPPPPPATHSVLRI